MLSHSVVAPSYLPSHCLSLHRKRSRRRQAREIQYQKKGCISWGTGRYSSWGRTYLRGTFVVRVPLRQGCVRFGVHQLKCHQYGRCFGFEMTSGLQVAGTSIRTELTIDVRPRPCARSDPWTCASVSACARSRNNVWGWACGNVWVRKCSSLRVSAFTCLRACASVYLR